MKSYENTFVRGPSPSYSDEAASENAMSNTLPIGQSVGLQHTNQSMQSNGADDFLDEKFNCVYKTASFNSHQPLKHGRNTFAFWTVVSVLLLLTVGNLILTLTIIGVLHLGRGIHGMELIPEEDVIKFYGETDLDRVYSKGINQIEGFTDVPVTITGEEGGGVYVRLHRNGQANNRMLLDKSGIQFRAVNTFEIKDPSSGNTIFTTHRPHYNMPTGSDVLVARTVSASRIVSPMGEALTLDADAKVSFKGSEGIRLDGSSALFQAEHNIVINSTQSATILEAGAGIYLDMDKVPVVSSEFGLRTGSVQYKICVCMPQGILFRIAIPRIHNGPKISCAHFSSRHDPCSIN